MAVNTSNTYGKITISDEAIACATGHIARECYGVIDLVGQGFIDGLHDAVKRRTQSRGVKVLTVDNRIYLELSVILQYGVSIASVTNNLKSAVKYGLEEFTGMIIDSVNINVIGVRV